MMFSQMAAGGETGIGTMFQEGVCTSLLVVLHFLVEMPGPEL